MSKSPKRPATALATGKPNEACHLREPEKQRNESLRSKSPKGLASSVARGSHKNGTKGIRGSKGINGIKGIRGIDKIRGIDGNDKSELTELTEGN